MERTTLERRIKRMILLFVVLLMLSGITAFPVYTELKLITDAHIFPAESMMGRWLQQVWEGVAAMNRDYPFLFYGYDWMAFAHIVIGLCFIGPYKDPLRNIWVIEWAMLACVLVLPLAFIAGPVRGIPWYHILIDCSFGIVGVIPLTLVRKWIKELEAASPRPRHGGQALSKGEGEVE